MNLSLTSSTLLLSASICSWACCSSERSTSASVSRVTSPAAASCPGVVSSSGCRFSVFSFISLSMSVVVCSQLWLKCPPAGPPYGQQPEGTSAQLAGLNSASITSSSSSWLPSVPPAWPSPDWSPSDWLALLAASSCWNSCSFWLSSWDWLSSSSFVAVVPSTACWAESTSACSSERLSSGASLP